jgi:hypothetical protein
MSDIAIRLDGIVLLAALLLGSAIYLLIVLSAIGIALCNNAAKPRAWRVARASGLMAVGTMFGFLILLYYWAKPYGIFFDAEWADWVAVPWGMLFIFGCWRLAKIR